MPCYDSRNEPQSIRQEFSNEIENNRRTIKKLEAMLCALATRMERVNEPFRFVDWAEAGVTQAQFLGWWRLHQEDDRQRKQREQETARRKLDKENALKKLTDREKKVLGLL